MAVAVVGAAAAVRRVSGCGNQSLPAQRARPHGVRSTSGYGHLVCRRSSFSAVCLRIARS
jgi:hypothetical protein